MPALNRTLEKCVFYLFREDPKTAEPTRIGGTGFFVARQSGALPYTYHVYAVSNRHVIADSSVLRVNTKTQSSRFIHSEPTDWVWSETDDLAVLDVTECLKFSTETALWDDDISWVDERDFVPEPTQSSYGIRIGDNTIMLGLFANHAKSGTNIPVGRFGSVAALPDASNPVSLHKTDQFSRPAYLNDMRSRSGFSGSPVWVWADSLGRHELLQGTLRVFGQICIILEDLFWR